MTGPYETEADALAEPLAHEVNDLHKPGRYRSDEIGHVVATTQLRHLESACAAAGVELGAFDRQTLAWLAGWEVSTVQVIIGLIARAGGTS
jgi:hypothetical protein